MRKPLPPSSRYFTLTLLLFLEVMGPACAQNFSAHNWYFGDSGFGVRFSRADNSASLLSNKAAAFAGTGGSAVVTDPVNGNLLFYTDGSNVFDVTHRLMPNGAGLTGNTAGNQPVVVAKIPGSATGYYVITNTASGAAGGTISSGVR